MPSLRASSRNGGEAGIVLLGRDRGKQPLALGLHDVGHLRRLHIVGAGRLAPRRSAATAASRLACGEGPSASAPGRP